MCTRKGLGPYVQSRAVVIHRINCRPDTLAAAAMRQPVKTWAINSGRRRSWGMWVRNSRRQITTNYEYYCNNIRKDIYIYIVAWLRRVDEKCMGKRDAPPSRAGNNYRTRTLFPPRLNMHICVYYVLYDAFVFQRIPIYYNIYMYGVPNRGFSHYFITVWLYRTTILNLF